MKAAGIVSSILIIIGLVVALLEAVIGFVGFLAIAIKILIILAFVGVFATVAFLIYRAWRDNRRQA